MTRVCLLAFKEKPGSKTLHYDLFYFRNTLLFCFSRNKNEQVRESNRFIFQIILLQRLGAYSEQAMRAAAAPFIVMVTHILLFNPVVSWMKRYTKEIIRNLHALNHATSTIELLNLINVHGNYNWRLSNANRSATP